KQAEIWKKVENQVKSILHVQELLQPNPERFIVERMRATALSDRTDYTNIAALTHALSKVRPDNLVKYLVVTSYRDLSKVMIS
ncbi:hypothetical protein PFISCL1PPCAC_8711, partial [Pristionchus fissidentatus]